jgi:hypothetical protein
LSLFYKPKTNNNELPKSSFGYYPSNQTGLKDLSGFVVFKGIYLYLCKKKHFMKKRFNITGNCFEQQHYMMDDSRRFNAILELVEYGDYFVINRPRQYGKTTMLFALTHKLYRTSGYLPIKLSFEPTDASSLKSGLDFAEMFLWHIQVEVRRRYPALAHLVADISLSRLEDLSVWISNFVDAVGKKVVLLIDEVDKSSNYEPFLHFLNVLRTKYLARNDGESTFHSVILAGVHDIKSLKFKLRNPEDAQTNSPWNVAVDFKVVMEFYPNEIAYMLRQYSEAEGVAMDFEAISERLFYHTSGYPFLISKLCKNIAEDILPKKADKTVWTLEDVEASVQMLMKENNTNFDSLIKNIENNTDLYNLVYRVLIESEVIAFNTHAPLMRLGAMYGIFKESENKLCIHNRVYEQIIYNYMAARRSEEGRIGGNTYLGDQFSDDNGDLDLEAVLRKFQSFMKEQRSRKDKPFIEREWRLIFLAFLKPIINGKGYDFKEVQISEEKRLDIVVTYLQHKYILELKLWHGEKAHGKGLNQLANYLDIHGVQKGYLLIFDTRKNLTWDAKPISHQGKEIFAVWL